MKFDDMARRAGRNAVAGAQRLERPELARVRARRSRTEAFAFAFAATLVIVGAAVWWPGGGAATDVRVSTTVATTSSVTPTTPTTAAVSPSTTTSTTTTTVAPAAPNLDVWTLAYPATWQRGSSDLMPALGWDSVTVATFPLRPGGASCAHVPENALRDMTAEDALVTVFFTGDDTPEEALAWPEEGFNDDVFPESEPTDADECSGRSDLEVHWGRWYHDGEALYVLAVFGADVPDTLRDELWSILSSLDRQSEGTDPGACVVTEPPLPGLDVPDSHPAQPPFGVWYGTTDLWTVLEEDAVYGPRKSVWWSADFPGGQRESHPDVLVTWRRLDGARLPLDNGGQATNAWDETSGWFMIAGIDPEEPGCWEITATYEDATLSYVAAIR